MFFLEKRTTKKSRKKNNKVLFRKKNYKKLRKKNNKVLFRKKNYKKLKGWGGRGKLGFPTRKPWLVDVDFINNFF